MLILYAHNKIKNWNDTINNTYSPQIKKNLPQVNKWNKTKLQWLAAKFIMGIWIINLHNDSGISLCMGELRLMGV